MVICEIILFAKMINSRNKRKSPICLVLIGVILIQIILNMMVIDTPVIQTVSAESLRSKANKLLSSVKLRSIINWNSYMRLYNKHYSSMVQSLARQKVFVARSIEVFLTGAKFKLYQISYYTAINKYSDLTAEETRKMLSGDIESEPNDPPMNDEEARELLLDAISSSENYSGSRESIELELKAEKSNALRNLRRRKRSVKTSSISDRDITLDDLIRAPHEYESEKHSDDKVHIQHIVPPENPNYDLENIRLKMLDLQKVEPQIQLNDIPVDKLDSPDSSVKSELRIVEPSNMESVHFIRSALTGVVNWFGTSNDDDNEETNIRSEETTVMNDNEDENDNNVVYLRDWRKTGCISEPRDQSYCQSCYAMSSMAFVEWAYCMNQNKILTPLSPQYMVSCGPQYREETQGKMGFFGCNQGTSKQTMYFVRDYGVELEANMPYVATDTECPIEPNTPNKNRGYIRPNVRSPIRLSGKTTQLDLALKNGPVIIAMRNPISFLSFGGGMVENCMKEGGHAMLVVGSLIENGVELLLIKNSFGPDWGSNGFFKLKRSALAECVKEFVVPLISFPGKKSQKRRVKAYIARQQSADVADLLKKVDDDINEIDKLFTNE